MVRRLILVGATLLLLSLLIAGCGIAQEEYDAIVADFTTAQQELQAVQSELETVQTEKQTLQTKVSELTSSIEEVKDELVQVIDELMQKDKEILQLELELIDLQLDYDLLEIDYDFLEFSYDNLEEMYVELETEHSAVLTELWQSLKVPYTAISGREITWVWNDLDGDTHQWNLPIDVYRSWIERTKPYEELLLRTQNGSVRMIDFRPYIYSESFSDVIPEFYQECADEWVFAKEIFNLVAQLTVYSEDIGEVPRWPVETFTEAGGDCEDLAILFASLLKASPYPFKLSLVYMDIDNPTEPQEPNHVIVWIEADDWKAFAECTSKQGWDYYDSVTGWYYEL